METATPEQARGVVDVENTLTWNVENWVTVTLMTVIGFTVFHMIMKAVNKNAGA